MVTSPSGSVRVERASKAWVMVCRGLSVGGLVGQQ
jgi:hypothetical protein